MGLACTRAVAGERGLTATTVLSEPLAAVLARAHPLAGARRLTLPALGGEALLLVRRQLGPALHADVVDALARAAAETPRVEEVSQMQTIVQLAAAGIGVGVVPRSATRSMPAGAVARPVAGLTARHRTDLVRRAGPPARPEQLFAEACRRASREIAAPAADARRQPASD